MLRIWYAADVEKDMSVTLLLILYLRQPTNTNVYFTASNAATMTFPLPFLLLPCTRQPQ
jgi:hypothetical protein